MQSYRQQGGRKGKEGENVRKETERTERDMPLDEQRRKQEEKGDAKYSRGKKRNCLKESESED